jgi:hypothetical protein
MGGGKGANRRFSALPTDCIFFNQTHHAIDLKGFYSQAPLTHLCFFELFVENRACQEE